MDWALPRRQLLVRPIPLSCQVLRWSELLPVLLIEGLVNRLGLQGIVRRLGRPCSGRARRENQGLRRPETWPQWYGRGICLAGTADPSRGQ